MTLDFKIGGFYYSKIILSKYEQILLKKFNEHKRKNPILQINLFLKIYLIYFFPITKLIIFYILILLFFYT